jgi:D-alanine--poly(phosphoribitol) ligase subunit 1
VGDLDMLLPFPIAPEEAARARRRCLRNPSTAGFTGSVVSELSRHAELTPGAPALLDGGDVMTYEALSRRVAAITVALRARSCEPGDVVACVGPRCPDSIAIFMALEAIGACYVPVDPGWPDRRLLDVLARSGATLVVDYREGVQRSEPLPAPAEQLVRLEELGSAVTVAPLTVLTPKRTDARYMIFTSGTTGMPKGAIVEQGGMMNHLSAKVADLDLGPGDTVAFSAPLVFDISIWQMLVAILVGGSVAVVRDEELHFPRRLIGTLEKRGVTVAELVPTVAGWIAEEIARRDAPALADLRVLLSTGEELYPSVAARILDSLPQTMLVNAYGPTECSDDVTHHVVSRSDLTLGRIPIGRPIANATLYLLVREGSGWRAAARGEAAELFVGGSVVGRGYANDPAATTAAFFLDTIDPTSETGRLYRTGDLARLDGDRLVFLGRIDRQVKVGGVRIELGEIESMLNEHPGVVSCAVTVIGGEPERLAAWCVTSQRVSANALIAWLRERLPASNVPHVWRFVSRLPLNGNGKVAHSAMHEWYEGKASRTR